MKIKLYGRQVTPGKAEGTALVTRQLMGWCNCDPINGYTTERNHPLFKVPFKGKVLVFHHPRGSGGWLQYGRSEQYGVGPAAFIYTKGCSLTSTACVIAGNTPAMTDFVVDVYEYIENGDHVFVNADDEYILITKK